MASEIQEDFKKYTYEDEKTSFENFYNTLSPQGKKIFFAFGAVFIAVVITTIVLVVMYSLPKKDASS